MNTAKETLFIADDEASIREGLKCIIDWEELGFRLCGEASNGKDALSQILALQPSLVLLDVKMPGLHGTEVIRLARESGFSGKCIILSGYADFAYAQQAIQCGVSSYCTKPLDEDELYLTVSKIRDMLSSEKAQSRRQDTYRSKTKSVILYDLMTGALEAPLLEADIRHFQLEADCYQIVLCEDGKEDSDSLPRTFMELLKVANQNNRVFEYLRADGLGIFLLKGSYSLHKFNTLVEKSEELPLSEDSPLRSLFITYGRPVDTLERIFLSYEDAHALLSHRFFCAQGQSVLGFDNLPKPFTPPPAFSDTERSVLMNGFSDRFIGYIQTFNRKMVVQSLEELEQYLMKASAGTEEIKLFIIDLYLQIKEAMNRDYASAKIPFLTNSSIIEFITGQKYLYEIIRFLSEQFEMMMNATGNPSRDTILDDVLFYIDHHFQSPVKLETIAPLFGYNSAYLGKLFTKTAGESFNSYIDHKRIEYSKKLLLENNLKVYEIAEQAGYKNVDYFHKKFKKYVGMSPAEFRRQEE